MRSIKFGIVLVTMLMAVSPAHAKKAMSDEQIKQAIIQESIDSYFGNCPCPYNTTSNGRSCGRRSAYSRPGGESPLCYASDVTKEMVRDFKTRQ